jgi:hypothetical protein
MEEDLARFETQIGLRLPTDYRDFLLLRNGGHMYRPSHRPLVFIPLDTSAHEKLEFDRSCIFHRLEWSDHYHDLWMRSKESHLLPTQLHIADIYRDKLFLNLGTAEPTVGLWVADWYEDTSGPPDRCSIFVAKSFAEMVHGAEPSCEPAKQIEPGFRAIERGDLHELGQLLSNGLNPNAINEQGTPLLFYAIRDFDYDAAKLLLNRGSDPDLSDGDTGRSPMFWAASGGNIDFAKLLLGHGAHKRMPDDPDVSILDWLKTSRTWSGNERIAALLQ